jgi:hypothetical protein
VITGVPVPFPTRRFAAGLIVVLACGAGCVASPDPSDVLVESHAVALNVLRDGSVEVREVFAVRFVGAPADRFRRHVPGDRVDAFIDVRAAVDGQPVTTDPDASSRVTIDRDGVLDVEWRFPPTRDETREFVVEYRAAGALAVHGASAELYWPVAPLEPAYPVAGTEVVLTVPPTAAFMTLPLVGASEPWTTVAGPRGLEASRAGAPPGEPAAVSARLATDTLALGQPNWQFDAALAAELMPAFVSAGLFMVVVGVGILWMLRVRYPDPRVEAATAGPDAATAGRLAPALRGVLRRRPGIRRAAAIEALREDLVAAGLVDPERLSVASGLKASGLATVGMAIACAAVVPLLLSRYGVSAHAVPAGMAVLGVMLFVAGLRFVVLTPAGHRAARQ